MPKKLLYPKEVKIASIKLEWIQFQVIAKMDQINIGHVMYYQVQCRRKKIANYKDEETAIRKMFAEANYELQNLFRITETLRKNTLNYYTYEDMMNDIEIAGLDVKDSIKNNISPAEEIRASQYKAPN